MLFINIIYTILLYLIQPLVWIKLWWCGKKNSEYRKRWNERYGFYNNKIIPNGILIHAVSLGEVISAKLLVYELSILYPCLPITFTTMTPSGSKLVRSIVNKNINHVYLPYDLPGSINRFLNFVNPILAIFIETEIWPNLIYKLHKRYIPIVIVNARISKKSLRNYKIIYHFIHQTLKYINLIAVQNIENANRFIQLGVNPNKLIITGNLKFDIFVSKSINKKIKNLKNQWGIIYRPTWIASSTHQGEEKILLDVHKKLLKKFPNLLLILAPRHPERIKNICKLAKIFSLNFILKTSGKNPLNNTQLIIYDTIGELMLMYGISDIAFIGGSLVKKGGHNPLEPAVHKIPILMGPYTWNFKEICYKLKQDKGLITINDKISLERSIIYLLNNEKKRKFYGKQAFKIIDKNNGTIQNTLLILKKYL